MSNTLGCINPVEEIVAIAHQHGALALIDACQSLPHVPIDVQKIGCDWLVAFGHKMFGPTGIGFLYGKLDLLRSLPLGVESTARVSLAFYNTRSDIDVFIAALKQAVDAK